jgi:hypothetical protein
MAKRHENNEIAAEELIGKIRGFIRDIPHEITFYWNMPHQKWIPVCRKCGENLRDCPRARQLIEELKDGK